MAKRFAAGAAAAEALGWRFACWTTACLAAVSSLSWAAAPPSDRKLPSITNLQLVQAPAPQPPKPVPPAGDGALLPPLPEFLPPAQPRGPFDLGLCPGPQAADTSSRLGGIPRPSPELLREYSQFLQGTVDPQATLDLVIGRPRVLVFKHVPSRIQLEVDEMAPVVTQTDISEREFSLTGRKTGTAVLNLWFIDPKDPTKEKILSYLIRVFPDPEAKKRLENVYKALADEINETFHDSHVCLNLVGDKLVLSGEARDIAEATQILRIVQSNAPQTTRGAAAIPLAPVTLTSATSATDLTGTASQTVQQTLRDYQVAGGPNIINLLRIPGEQQVMLKVTVAEVNRAAARSIGANFAIRNMLGMTVFTQTTGNLLSGGTTGTGTTGTGSGPNITALLDNGQISAAIIALQSLNLARSLAEPNLTTMNGKPARFQAGGQFPVPVVTGFTAAGLQGVAFVPFGVQLSFTPFITDKDRIRLEVTADVSTKDLTSAATVGNTNVPGLTTRNFSNTVELREGQTLAVAGLIQNNYSATATRVPFFGDLPFIGRLFAVDSTSLGEQELVVLVTPELVHPVDHKDVQPLPGSDIFEPSDVEFYLLGALESHRAEDFRSTARTDLDRVLRYCKCEDLYIIGPKGHSDGRP